jgi:transketolase
MQTKNKITSYDMSTGETHSTRKAFGETMEELALQDKRILAVSGDLTISVNLTDFEEKIPDQFINFGVAEQNMVATASGLAISGMIPFVASFASFLIMRACEQIRNDCAYANTNMKLVGANAGISGGPAGPTHHAIEDIGILRSMPNMSILTPADSHETTAAVRLMAREQGPMYLRLGRDPWPLLHANVDEIDYRLGESECFRDGNDVTIFAIGNMVSEAIQASERLSEEGIGARVVSFFSIKPIDRQAILAAARETGAIVTVEDHNVLGGLGAAVAEVAAEAGATLALKRLGVPDCFAPVGDAADLYALYKMNADGIIEAVKELL